MINALSPPDEAAHLRRYLRQRTAAAHAELDALVGVLDSMDRYARYLAGQFRFRAGMESLLSRTAFPAWIESWRPLELAKALRADLNALQLEVPAPPGASGPAQHLAGASGLIGVLYVLEGAALGARYLYRSVCALGLTRTSGACHLELQTSGERWQEFLGLLGCRAIDREEAAAAAVATFAYARGAFAKDIDD